MTMMELTSSLPQHLTKLWVVKAAEIIAPVLHNSMAVCLHSLCPSSSTVTPTATKSVSASSSSSSSSTGPAQSCKRNDVGGGGGGGGGWLNMDAIIFGATATHPASSTADRGGGGGGSTNWRKSPMFPLYPCVSRKSPFNTATAVGLCREVQALLGWHNPLGLSAMQPWATTLDNRWQRPHHLTQRLKSNCLFFWANYLTTLLYVVLSWEVLCITAWSKLNSTWNKKITGLVMVAFYVTQVLLVHLMNPLEEAVTRWLHTENRMKLYAALVIVAHSILWLSFVWTVLSFVCLSGGEGYGGIAFGLLAVLLHATFKPREWSRTVVDKMKAAGEAFGIGGSINGSSTSRSSTSGSSTSGSSTSGSRSCTDTRGENNGYNDNVSSRGEVEESRMRRRRPKGGGVDSSVLSVFW
eukprot:GHVQ01041314.1.p1 GENE.GHVQ01041314.1~~GHVQ01041314.1.p1  ORF type:complete len:410 (-),score=102.96 GHVQ01041314.1:81-1310(-)